MNGTHIELDRLPLRIVQAIVLLLIVVKLAQLTFTGVFMDESYYWMWGQHPACRTTIIRRSMPGCFG